jgi:porphobilinogen synthase
MHSLIRPRRLRHTAALRNLIQENNIRSKDLILPLFIHHDPKQKKAISSMPGHFQLGLDHLAEEIESIVSLNIPGVILFGIPAKKDEQGSDAYHSEGIIQQAIRKIKQMAPDLLVIADCCFCEYTVHGHCGIVPAEQTAVDNDLTLEILAKAAVAQAQAGADIIAPSGMMDGMVGAIRFALDQSGYSFVSILSYSVKYASSLYGPFREAAEGAPQFGDRKTYQMDPANREEALREVRLDVEQGADMLMVKPALLYLDIIQRVKTAFPELPLAAYQVSGEFAMIKAAAQRGWLDHDRLMLESLLSIKRAGANFIISYFAKELAFYEKNQPY